MKDIEAFEEQATRLSLIAIFLASFTVFSSRLGGRGQGAAPRPFDLVLLGLATYRTGRLVAYDRVLGPLREPFTETRGDATGAGQTVVAEGRGVRYVLGELLSCPVCVGTWVSAALVYGLWFAPLPTRVFLWIQGTIGLAEILSWTVESLTWFARATRKRAAT